MKERFIYILVLILSLFCISCDREDSMPVAMEYPVVVEVGSVETKVGINGNSLFWESGDQLQFRATSASGETATTVLTLNDVDSGLATAKFKGTVTMSEQPTKCEFAYNSSSFTEDGNIIFDYSQQDGTHKPYLYGVSDYSSDGMTCQLKHVGGLFRIKVPDGVISISLSSNSGEYTPSSDGTHTVYKGQSIAKVTSSSTVEKFIPIEDASHLISAEVPVGAETIYAFAPAVEYLDGISIVCSHSDGSKMFKSFSKTGGTYSSFVLGAGSVVDLDMGVYSGFTADCTCSWQHEYEGDSNMLTGTKVSLTDFSFSGSPSKIIDMWGAAIYDAEGHFVRWITGDGAYKQGESKVMEDMNGDWPLLIPNMEYTVYAICSINGHTLSFPSATKLTVLHPNITVTPIAETSWSYRSDSSKANGCGNNTIERFALKVNVSDNIINHANTDYGFTARLQNTTTGFDSGNIEMKKSSGSISELNVSYNTTTGEYELKQGDGLYILGNLEWKTHKVTASVTFAEKTYNAAESVDAYVTGLPYRHNFREAEGLDGGLIKGSRENWHSYNGYEIYKCWTAVSPKYDNQFYSRTFPLPESVTVKYNTSFFFVNTGSDLSKGKCKAYTGITDSTDSPSTASFANLESENFTNLDAIGSCAANTEHVVSGNGTFSSTSRISASIGDKDMSVWVETGLYMGKLEILYN